MALRFLGKDPDSGQNGCPIDLRRRRQLRHPGMDARRRDQGSAPRLASDEDAVRIPKRMMALFPEVSGK
jgi:hypothetical protein